MLAELASADPPTGVQEQQSKNTGCSPVGRLKLESSVVSICRGMSQDPVSLWDEV